MPPLRSEQFLFCNKEVSVSLEISYLFGLRYDKYKDYGAWRIIITESLIVEFTVIVIIAIVVLAIFRSKTVDKPLGHIPNENLFQQAFLNLEAGNLEGWRSKFTEILDQYNIVLSPDSELDLESISALNQDLIQFDEKHQNGSKVSLQTTVISEIMQKAESSKTQINENQLGQMVNPGPQDIMDSLLSGFDDGIQSDEGVINLFLGYVVSDDFLHNMSFKASIFDQAEDDVNTDDPNVLEDYIRNFANDYQSRDVNAVSKLAYLLQRGIVGKLDRSGKFVEDYDAAVDNLHIAAHAGDADSQLSLGIMFLTGEHLPIDYTKAEKWLSEAAQQENYFAFEHLLRIYEEGHGVHNSPTRVEKLKAESSALYEKMFSNI